MTQIACKTKIAQQQTFMTFEYDGCRPNHQQNTGINCVHNFWVYHEIVMYRGQYCHMRNATFEA